MQKVSLVLVALLFCCAVLSAQQKFNRDKVYTFLHGRSLDGEQEKSMNLSEFAHVNAGLNGENPYEISGYFNVNSTYGGHMYYVFFPAKNKNPKAPTILWLQGGPGCSSMTGLFAEMGPFKIDPTTLTLKENPHTWNNNYNMLFIDNPVGAGFSYIEKPDGYVHSEDLVAIELYSCLTQFFDKYSQYKALPFYVFGESYAGKYVPAIAYKIATEGFKLNLAGIGIGDGLTHPIEQFTAYDEFLWGAGLINIAQRAQLIAKQNVTINLIQKGQWTAAMDSVDDALNWMVDNGGGVNVYDIRTYGDYDFSAMEKYLALPQTKKLMHTEGHAYHDCDTKAYMGLRDDMPQSIRDQLIYLLNNNLRVMLYNGQYDLIINTPAAVEWVANMPWNGRDQFRTAARKVWTTGGNTSGWVQQYRNLIQVVVSGAGHLSPFDQPVSTLDMVTRFIEQKPF